MKILWNRFPAMAVLLLIMLPLTAAQGDILLTEIGASNQCIYFDENGKTPDWVELYNSGTDTVSLEGWALSDSASAKKTLSLDGKSIGAGEYLAVGLPEGTFGLSKSGETVYLFNGGELSDSVTYPEETEDVSWALMNGEWCLTWLPTPGGENRYLAEGEIYPAADGLRFSEILTCEAPGNDAVTYDYIELVNAGATMNTKGWTVQLGMGGSKIYSLEAKGIGRGYYTYFYCTDKTTKHTHAEFTLPKQGVILSLWNEKGELVDYLRLPEQYGDISWGLAEDGETFGYFANQTPGKANGKAYSEKLTAPELSIAGGVYAEESVTVSITAQEGAVIRYTVDGSRPKSSSPEYTEPITLTSTTVVRAAAFGENVLQSNITCATYVLDADITVPVVCLVIDEGYLYNSTKGLLTGKSGGTSNYRKHWEYPANLEYFTEDGTCTLNQACGFGIQGDSSRGYRQKAFQLVARSCYGNGDTFDFAPFANRSFTSYHTLNLRAAGSEGTGNLCTYFRDACLSTLAEEHTTMLTSAAVSVMVYLNGKPYGHYNLRERVDKWFVARHLGITDKDEIDQIDLLVSTGKARTGSSEDYRALRDYMKKHDLNDPQALNYVLDQMDVQSYFEYVAFTLCCGNADVKNSRFFRVPGGKWTWLLYDVDKAMQDPKTDRAFKLYTASVNAYEESSPVDHVPFAALMKVPEMKDRFLTILGNLMADAFAPDVILARIDEWHDMVAPTIPTQLKLWTKNTVAHWEKKVEGMKECAIKRPDYVLRYTKKYFKLTDEQMQTYFAAYYAKTGQNQ